MLSKLLLVPRLLFCFFLFFIGVLTLYKGLHAGFFEKPNLQVVGAAILLISATSFCYHISEDKTAERIDMTVIAMTIPFFLYFSLKTLNFLPVLMGAVAAGSFMANREALSWENHFYGVHLPAAIGLGSLAFF